MRALPKLYAQRDPQWSGIQMGTVKDATIGQYGCYISSFAMLACYYGHQLNPADVNNLFKNGIYISGDLCPDNGLTHVFPDCIYQQNINYPKLPADLNLLKTLLSDPSISVIIELDFNHNPNDGVQTHFVVAVDCDGSTVTIADPWYNSIDSMTKNYGDNPAQTIIKYVVYKGKPSAQGGASPMIYKGIDTTNLDSVKVTIDVWDDVVNQKKYVTVEKYTADMQSKDDVITNLNGVIGTDNNQIKTLNGTIDNMNLAAQQAQTKIDALQLLADQLEPTKALFNQANDDRTRLQGALDTANRSIAQLKNTSYLTADNGIIINELVARFGRWLSHQKTIKGV